MPAYNFQERFVEMILDGTKYHTIRRRRKRLTREGDALLLYTGMRTKKCALLAETTCEKVESLVIWVKDRLLSRTFMGPALSKDKTILIAHGDGFNNTKDFFEFFERYGQDYLEGFEMIWWDPSSFTQAAPERIKP